MFDVKRLPEGGVWGGAFDHQNICQGREFEQLFGHAGQEFEQGTLQKFKCPGWRMVGMLKF